MMLRLSLEVLRMKRRRRSPEGENMDELEVKTDNRGQTLAGLTEAGGGSEEGDS